MNALIFEDEQHKIHCRRIWKRALEGAGYHTKDTTYLDEALEFLRAKSADIVVVHHMDFSEIDALRQASSKSTYIAYSGNCRRKPEKGSMGEEFNRRMLEHYDILMFSGDSLHNLVTSLAKR